MKKLNQIVLYILTIIFLVVIKGYGQETIFENAFEFTDTIESKFINETRTITVQLPKSYYETTTQNYSVLYVLDARLHQRNTNFIHNFLAEKGHISESILVFIHDTGNRSRDYNTFFRDTETINEGADHFLNFLEKETIPFVESKYRASNYRMLSGHSNGGLFVIHSLIKRPDLFRARFAFSASSHHIPKQRALLKEFLINHKDLHSYFYMNVGGSEFYKQQDSYNEIKQLFQDYAAEGLRFDFDHHDADGHQSSPFIGQYMAFKRLYAPFRLNEVAYEKMSYDDVVNHFDEISLEFGYEIKPREGELVSMGNYFTNYIPNLKVVENLIKLAQYYYPDSKEIKGNFIFYKQWLANGISNTIQYAGDLKPNEAVLNFMGYHNLRNQHSKEALYLFKLAIQLYPNSANPYDSYGEALEGLGNLEKALKMYQKAYTIANSRGEDNTAYFRTNVERVEKKIQER